MDGAAVAATLTARLMTELKELKEHGVVPTLAILRIGAREDDLAYERGILRRCNETGIHGISTVLCEDDGEEVLLTHLERINQDPSIHGCLLLRPLPARWNDMRIRAALSPEKDVDGVTDRSLGGVFTADQEGFPPCTAKACMEILHHYGVPVAGRRVVVAGRSFVIGRPVAMMLLSEDATVSICHSKTKDLASICREADILIAATGVQGMITPEFVHGAQVILDVGIHVNSEGNLCGDVDASASACSAMYTSAPGGVGAVTTMILLRHVAEAAGRQRLPDQGRN
jgi:methylenetetrahydrofolate dehydrogenase (NADP+)/methenyltetrahydrofolate cyclohydrolase